MQDGMLARMLRLLAERRGSDLFLAADAPAQLKVEGELTPLSAQRLRPGQPRELLAELLGPEDLARLDAEGELNTGLRLDGVASFRLSAFHQRGTVAAVFRCIPWTIPPLETLGLPEGLADLARAKRGLVLVVGATGSGKSTTLAAMLDHRNRHQAGHVLTIEDPIEFLFRNERSLVNQREVGRDTESLAVALRNALRQAPDCLMIGEVRDRETMSAAISYALSGHLVLATLHANNASHALGRILSLYPLEARAGLLDDLAAALQAVISQRLLRGVDGKRLAAVEVLRNTQLVAERIAQGDLGGVRAALEQSLAEGSQTFEQDLARLIQAGRVPRDEALAHADSPSNLMWRLDHQGAGGPVARAPAPTPPPEGPTFTDIALDLPDPPG